MRDTLELAISGILVGTFLQITSALVIYIHVLSYALLGLSIPQKTSSTTLSLYLLLGLQFSF